MKLKLYEINNKYLRGFAAVPSSVSTKSVVWNEKFFNITPYIDKSEDRMVKLGAINILN